MVCAAPWAFGGGIFVGLKFAGKFAEVFSGKMENMRDFLDSVGTCSVEVGCIAKVVNVTML